VPWIEANNSTIDLPAALRDTHSLISAYYSRDCFPWIGTPLPPTITPPSPCEKGVYILRVHLKHTSHDPWPTAIHFQNHRI
jgi:hypothetical protein